MAAKYWIKLYHEILDDPKMGRLPDRLWRRTIEFFLLAGELDQEEGRLPAASDMAWRLRTTDLELEQDLAELERIGLLTRFEDGTLFVTKFAERQAARTSTQRTQMQRERDRRRSRQEPERDASVADLGRSRDDAETKRPTDTDTESEKDSETESFPPPPPKRARRLNGHARQEEEADIPNLSTELSTGLDTAGVFRGLWPEIAASGRSEAELLALLAWSSDSESKTPGALFVSRLRGGADPPAKYFEPAFVCCGRRNEHAESCPERYVTGQFADRFEH